MTGKEITDDELEDELDEAFKANEAKRDQCGKPIPTNKEIDLGTLNTLVKDFAVKIIECDGPETNILVRGNMGTKTTKIILTKEEINNLIQKFSKTAKIPAYGGIFRVVVGRLILLAIISEVVGSKFIIKKFAYNPFHQQK